jgi:hypothetical protein
MTATQLRPSAHLDVRPVPGPRARAASRWPLVSVCCCAAAGVLGIGAADALARSGHRGTLPDVAFWVGLLILIGPIAFRLLSGAASRQERLFLVAVVGLATYSLKVLYSPSMFVMSDESVHLAAAQHVAATHSLFQSLTVKGAPIASGYPGLEAVTVVLHQVTGLPLLASGLVIIGAARLIMMLALYLLVERVTRSARLGGLAALLFVANGNFLFWSAQFSYESLSLPLFMATMVVVVTRARQPRDRVPLSIMIGLLTVAIAATHHLTSYALAAVLWVLTVMAGRPRWRAYRSIVLAGFAAGTAVFWALVAAPGTWSYLAYTFNRAANGVLNVVSGRGARIPFQSSSGTLQTPLAERLVSFGAVAVVGVSVLLVLWRRRRWLVAEPGTALLALAGLAFLAIYPLRAAPAAWETANRAQEFLFVGAASLLALAARGVAGTGGVSVRRRAIAAVGICFIICGGVIAGWPAPLRLAPPLNVRVANAVLWPEGLTAAEWALAHLGRNATYVGDEATGRELAVRGAKAVYIGSAAVVPQLLHDSALPQWEIQFLIANHVDFIVLDRRKISADDLAGPFFPLGAAPDSGRGYFPDAVRQKYERLPQVSSVFDSGDIVIYDVRSLRSSAPQCDALGPPALRIDITCRSGGQLLAFPDRSGVATFGGWRALSLGSDAVVTAAGMQLTVRFQLQNLGHAPLVVNPRAVQAVGLIGGGRYPRARSPEFRRDDLKPGTIVPANTNVERSVSFELRGRALIRALRHAHVELHIPAGPAGEQVAVLTAAPLAMGSH